MRPIVMVNTWFFYMFFNEYHVDIDHIFCNCVFNTGRNDKWNHSLRFCGFFRENPQHKIALFVWFEGGGNNDVLPCRQTEAWAHLPKVDEQLGASAGRVLEKEVTLQMHTCAAQKLPRTYRSLWGFFYFMQIDSSFSSINLSKT